jgi:TM2 domain-containing membrane protein YozV/RNA polymerase subunit RPABC4/transcription elongation factor Spt4
MGTWLWMVLDQSFLGNVQSDGLATIIMWIIFVFLFLWIVGIIWVCKDVNARTNSLFFQIVSILFVALLTPVLGLPLYLSIRPVGYKRDKMPWREASATKLILCQNCQEFNPKEYTYCISCGHELKITCKECGHQYPHSYHYCNVCGAPNIEI